MDGASVTSSLGIRGNSWNLEADHSFRHVRKIENAIRDLKHWRRPQSFPLEAASPPTLAHWLAVQVLALHNAGPTGPRASKSGRGAGDHQDPPAALQSSLAKRMKLTRSARRLTLHLPQGWPWEDPVHSRPGSIASPAIACLTAPTAPGHVDQTTQPPHRVAPARSADCLPLHAVPIRPSPSAAAQDRHRAPAPTKGRHRPHLSVESSADRRVPRLLTPCSNPKAAPHRLMDSG